MNCFKKISSFRMAGRIRSKHLLPLLAITVVIVMATFLHDPSVSAGGFTGGFFESFAIGKPSAPQVFTPPRWILGPGPADGLGTHNPGTSNEYETHEPIEAGHGPNCEAPINNFDANGNQDPTRNNHILPN